MGVVDIDQSVLVRIEAEYASGISSVAILDVLASLGVKFSEGTLRKWVQLGLLPRSIRVGTKGKHTGSHGLYPPGILRQILEIKALLARGMTIEQIQSEVLFVRGELLELDRAMSNVFLALEEAVDKVEADAIKQSISRQLNDARLLARQLMEELESAEYSLIYRNQSQFNALTG